MANPTTNLGITLPVDDTVATKVPTYNEGMQELDATIGGWLDLSVAGAAGTTALTRDQALHKTFKFTGVLTGNRVITIPATGGAARDMHVWNATSGAFTLTIKMSSGGTGVAVTQGKKVILSQNGSEVYAFAAEV